MGKHDKFLHRDFSGGRIGSNQIKNLIEMLDAYEYITSVDLSNNAINDEGAKILAKTNLKKLQLECNDISDEGARALLQDSKNLSSLSLAGNFIGEIPMRFPGTLKELILNCCNIKQVNNNIPVAILGLGSNPLNLKSLKRLIEDNPVITSLDLSNVKLDADIIKTIAKNSHLISLDLRLCELTDAMVEPLYKNTTITSLKLAENIISQVTLERFNALAYENLCKKAMPIASMLNKVCKKFCGSMGMAINDLIPTILAFILEDDLKPIFRKNKHPAKKADQLPGEEKLEQQPQKRQKLKL